MEDMKSSLEFFKYMRDSITQQGHDSKDLPKQSKASLYSAASLN